MAAGLDLLASYTWSKAIDNMSDEATAGLPVTGIAFFNLDLDREFAAADFDVRQSFTSGFTWKLPSPGTRAWRRLGGGWSLQGIVRARTGFPFHVTTQVVDPLNFGSNRRVDYLGGPNMAERSWRTGRQEAEFRRRSVFRRRPGGSVHSGETHCAVSGRNKWIWPSGVNLK